jgi:tetratricopeptide (TPR) repeat protein
MSSGEIVYRQQRKFCGKSRCRKCREGIGHGPYWFATEMVNGKKTQVYLGKRLPPGVQAAQSLPIHTAGTIPATSSSPSLAQREAGVAQIGRAHQGPLIGRDAEQQAMRSLLLQVEQYRQPPPAGQGRASDVSLAPPNSAQCVLLLGEAGIGKTRLAEEVGRLAGQRGWSVVWGRTHAQESAIPYGLWTEVLRTAVASHTTATRKLLTSSAHAFEPLLALLPALTSATPPPAPPAEQEPHRLWEAIHRLLAVLSAHAPLLVVLDDLQWADESSCSLLAYLARRLPGHAIIIVGTCREQELGASHPLRSLLAALQQERAALALPLGPLSDEQIGAIISAIPNVSESAVQRIQINAAGNPFFAEELARISQLARLDDVASDPEEITFSPLPATITAAFDLRLSRLSRACQQLLSRAAILGDSFNYPILRALEAHGSTDEGALLDLLEEALQAGILTEEGGGLHATYRFWHPLLVSHLSGGLSIVRRTYLHRQAAALFQQVYRGREDEGAATIVYHLVQGGADAQEIAHYAELAADHAYRLSAHTEAERYYRVAVEQVAAHRTRVLEPCMTTHIDRSERQVHLASLLERWAECTMILGNYQEARRLYEQLLHMNDSPQFPATSPDAVKHEPLFQAIVWCEIGLTWYFEGDPAQARQCCECGEQVLRESGIVAGPAWANLLYLQGWISWQEGNYTAARSSAQQALKLFEEGLSRQHRRENMPFPTRIRRTLAGDPVDLGRIQKLLALIAVSVGQTTEATIHLNEAIAIFEQYDRQREIAIVCNSLGDIHLRKAEYSLAQAVFHRALSIAERIGDTPLMSACLGNLGLVAARLGDLAQAEDLLRRGLTLAERVSDPVNSNYWRGYLALVLQEQGKVVEARDCMRSALTTSRSRHLSPCIGFALVTLGQMRIAQAATDTADPLSRAAQSVPDHEDIRRRLLWRAESSLRRALSIEGLEAEANIEGQLAFAQISLLRGEWEKAQQQALHALQEAQGSELTWLLARTRRLLGAILAMRDNDEQADAYFQQALQVFRESSMRLEYARALRSYGGALLRREHTAQQGLLFLQEARQVFSECHAILDMQAVERLLSTYFPAPHLTIP